MRKLAIENLKLLIGGLALGVSCVAGNLEAQGPELWERGSVPSSPLRTLPGGKELVPALGPVPSMEQPSPLDTNPLPDLPSGLLQRAAASDTEESRHEAYLAGIEGLYGSGSLEALSGTDAYFCTATGVVVLLFAYHVRRRPLSEV